jgi:hypothetical protein
MNYHSFDQKVSTKKNNGNTIFDKVITSIFAGALLLGIGYVGYTFVPKYVSEAKVISSGSIEVADPMDGSPDYIEYIKINKHDNCLDDNSHFSWATLLASKSLRELQSEDSLETIVIKRSLWGCDHLIYYNVR